MAYLGRISAVLTANTTAFRREIGDSRRELLNFARQARGTQFNLDNRALNGTLTNLQRFRAELRAIRRLQAEGVGADLPNPRRLRDQFRLFEDLGKPLTEVKNRIEGLSNSIQTELYPELEAIQRGFQRVYRAIDAGSTTFNRSAGAIDNLRQRLIGLSRATAALSDLNSLSKQLSANNSGASFFTPRAQEALQRSLALRSQAQQLPGRFREGAFADLAVQAEENAERIERAAARVARAQLRVITEGENPDTLTERGRRQAELDALTRQQRGINLGFEREIASAQIRQIISPEAVRPVDALIERAGKLAVSLRENNSIRFDPLIASVGRVIEQLNRGQVSAKRAKEAVDALAGADFSKAFAASSFAEADKTLRTDSERTIAEIRKNAADERRNVVGRVGSLRLLGPNRMRAIEDINRRETISLDREEFNRSVVGQFPELKKRAEELKDPRLLQGFDNLRRLAQDASNSIKSAFDAANPQAAQAAVDAYKLKISALSTEVEKYERAVKSAETANRRFGQFLELSGGRGDKLGASLTRFASDIATTRQLAGNFSSGNVSGRSAVERQIERNYKFAERVARAQQKIADNSSISDAERQRRRQLIDRTVARRREENLDTLVSASGGTLTKSRAQAAMERNAKNQGSIGVGGVAVAQLAFQQGLFAIDDFISATGGVEYKLRAIGNNITQLGLLLGQSGLIPGLSATTGLMIGLGAVIGGQVVSAFVKWAFETDKAEDRTKALNDSLSRQKSLVEELAGAFESLGESISRRAFSEPGQEALQFARDLDRVAKKQKELRESRVASLDEAVQRERGTQNTLRRKLESEANPGTRVDLQRQIEDSQRRERAAVAVAAGRRVSGDDVGAAIEKAILRAAGFDINPNPGIRRDAAEARKAVPTGSSPESVLAQRKAIEDQISSLQFMSRGGNTGATAAIADLELILKSLELPIQEALDTLSSNILRASLSAAIEIESAQNDVADAIARGVSGAAVFQQNLDNLAGQMESAQARLKDAQKIEDPAERERQVRQAERDINGIRVRQDAIAEQSREIRLTSGRGGDRTTSALSALQGNERFANEYGRLVARLRDAADAETAARRELDKAIASGSDADKEAARAAYEAAAAASDLAAAAAEAALAMEQAVARIRKIGADAVSQSERMADEAQQRLNERPTDANLQRRDEAERQLIRDRESVARANNALDRRRSELQESDPRLMQVNAELEAINQERRRLSDEAAKSGTTVSASDAQRLADREAQLLAEREQRLFSLTEAERRQQDAINQEIRARERLVDFMDEVERRRNPQGDPVRGLDLLDTPGQRAARELRQSGADIASAVEQSIALAIREGRFGDIAGIQQRGREAQDRAREDALRQQAPAIFGLADSVTNALLQGPSRAALQPTDISTVEGSRELTRLLRGDDAARDQANLVELQKEANRLLDLIANAPAPIAN